ERLCRLRAGLTRGWRPEGTQPYAINVENLQRHEPICRWRRQVSSRRRIEVRRERVDQSMIAYRPDPRLVAVRNPVEVAFAALRHRSKRLGNNVRPYDFFPSQPVTVVEARAGGIAVRIRLADANPVVVRAHRWIAHAEAENERQFDAAAKVAQMPLRPGVREQEARRCDWR